MALTLLILGCGTIQHVVPPVPLGPGKSEFRIGIGYSTSPITRLSVQLVGYFFTSTNDAIGMTCAGVLPSSVSYMHYWPSPSGPEAEDH